MMNAMRKVGAAAGSTPQMAAPVVALLEASSSALSEEDETEDQRDHNRDEQKDEGVASSKQTKKKYCQDDEDDEEKQKQHEDYYDDEYHYSSKLIRSSRRSIVTQRAYCWVRVVMLLAIVVVIAVVVPLTMSSRREEEEDTNNAMTTKDSTTLDSNGGQDKHDEGGVVDGGVTSGTIANSVDPTTVTPATVPALVCPTSTPLGMTFAFEKAVSGIVTLHEELAAYFPDHLEDHENYNPTLQEGDFNVSSYFQVLDGLSLPEGKVLEYFYHFDAMGVYPVLYVRDINTEKPFFTLEDFEEHDCEEQYPCLGETLGGKQYLDEMRLEGTPESFVDLVTLEILGGQFYLHWHANYYDHKIIYGDELIQSLEPLAGSCACTDDIRGGIVGDWDEQERRWNEHGCLSSAELDLLRATTDLTPTLECDNDEVRVSVVVYTNWGGFSRRFYTIGRYNGRLEHASETEELLAFECGIVI